MIKFKQGAVGPSGSDKLTTDIVVKAVAPNTLKDALVGGSMVMAGIIYLTYTAFKHGSRQYERAELYALREAGVINWDPEEILGHYKS